MATDTLPRSSLFSTRWDERFPTCPYSPDNRIRLVFSGSADDPLDSATRSARRWLYSERTIRHRHPLHLERLGGIPHRLGGARRRRSEGHDIGSSRSRARRYAISGRFCRQASGDSRCGGREFHLDPTCSTALPILSHLNITPYSPRYGSRTVMPTSDYGSRRVCPWLW